MDVPQQPPDEAFHEGADRERSSVLASPAFWLAALASLAFWVLLGLFLVG